jgi:hypothetical protein
VGNLKSDFRNNSAIANWWHSAFVCGCLVLTAKARKKGEDMSETLSGKGLRELTLKEKKCPAREIAASESLAND